MLRTGTLIALLAVGPRPAVWAAPPTRFFVVGDGQIQIRSTKNRHRFDGRFREADGRYIPRALRQINRVIGGSYARAQSRISLRLIELLSHVRKQLAGGWITISSGYRSPHYNRALRDRGGTVARASLHQYGMAVDLRIEGVDSKAMWDFVRENKLGGAGYYGSPWVHVDVGPPRHWRQGTANVRKGLSLHNQRIMLVPLYDIYAPGEQLSLRFARMTAWPIDVQRRFVLERLEGGTWKEAIGFRPGLRGKRGGTCALLGSVARMAGIEWRLPPGIAHGRYRVRAGFCKVRWKEMPRSVVSTQLQIVK